MGFYTTFSMKLFHELSFILEPYFSELKEDLKRGGMRISSREYIARSVLTSFLVFLFEVPILSFIFGFVFKTFLFSFLLSFTISIFLSATFFFLSLNYPKVIVKERSKKVDSNLPFAELFLSTISGSKLPLYMIFDIFSKFGGYGEINREVSAITNDVRVFGLDVNTSVERAIERTPSKAFKELLWGILSVNRTGGELDVYLRGKSEAFIAEHRRKLYEYSQQLMFIIEIYLTAVVMGAIFFTILTAIMGGLAGGTGGLLILQFLLIFIFLPLLSAALLVVIKSMAPGGE